MTLAPPALRDGDTIAVVAPAGPVPEARLAAGLKRLEKRYKLLVAPDIYRREDFLAGGDARRTEEFNAALRNSEVRAIWAARGGYGCSRIVDNLDADAFVADPVPIIGFSDVTVLLCWAAALGVRSIHGPVVTQLGELGDEDVEWALTLARGGGVGEAIACSAGTMRRGRLIGGNLSLLAHLCGSQWQPDYHDALCVLEDIGERPYAVDRYLTQILAQPNGKTLRAAAAVLLGDFTRCEETKEAQAPAGTEVLAARLQGLGVHTRQGLAVGHGLRNRAFPVGAVAEAGTDGLRLLEPATSA